MTSSKRPISHKGADNLLVELARWAPNLRIQTQVTTDSGRPDIEIADQDLLVYIEVKNQSDVDEGQLRRYSQDLADRKQRSHHLVLLTRCSPGEPRIRYLAPPVRWPAVYRWLNEVIPDSVDETTRYLITEFRGLMGGLGMAIGKVGWELVPGLSAALDLRRMALEQLGVQGLSGQGADYTGRYFENAKFFAGVDFDDPAHLYFAVKKEHAPERLLTEWENVGTPWRRTRLDLESEEVYFFSRTAESQLECVKEFLRASMSQCKSREGK